MHDWEIVFWCECACLNDDVEDFAQIFGWQGFLFDNLLYLADEYRMQVGVHWVVLDVSDSGENLEETNHVRVTELCHLRYKMLNQLTVKFTWALARFAESRQDLHIIMRNEVPYFW